MNAHRFLRSFYTLALTAALAGIAHAQAFSSGSTGADGVLDVTTEHTLAARQNGVFHFTSIRVRPGAVLRFARHEANPPIHLLATKEVIVEGTIDISGSLGTELVGGSGGSGGFDGGHPGIAGKPPGAGHGPGGGGPGEATSSASGAGGGSYATLPTASASTQRGVIHGSELLLPLLGGSGGGGQPGAGGTGGGGALLIASTLSIAVPTGGIIRANCGFGGAPWGYGSGGAIRLVAPRVSGTGVLDVTGYGLGGDGRIRVDLVHRDQLALSFQPGTPGTLVVGSLMTVFPPVTSQLDITAVGSERFAPGSRNSVFVNLPAGSSPNQQVELQARDFNQLLPVTVALIPDSGPASFYHTSLDNRSVNPVTLRVNVSVPANVLVRVMAWTR